MLTRPVFRLDHKVIMIEVYKILTNKYDSRVNVYLEKQQDSITRGHSLKLANQQSAMQMNGCRHIVPLLNSTNHPKRRVD